MTTLFWRPIRGVRLVGKLVVLLSLSACGQDADLAIEQSHANALRFTGPIMGTTYIVTVVGDELDTKAQVESAQIEARLDRLIKDSLDETNSIMSHYDPESELSRLNRLKANSPTKLSDDLASVLVESMRIYELSGGAFDVTLSPAIDAWGFGPSGAITSRPSDTELQDIKSRVGSNNVKLDDAVLIKSIDSLEFNLSAIAKGYAIDKLAQRLVAAGFENFLINVGGELKARGHNQEGVNWRIAIEQPHVLGGIGDVLVLQDRAVATSGDYRNFIEIDGQRYSHTIDSNTLMPVLHKLALVTVVHESATTADGLATAILAMGDKEGIEFANRLNLDYYALIRTAKNEYIVRLSESLKPLIQ